MRGDGMWLKWFPWRFVVSRFARSHGFLDPIALLSRMDRFAQPSEVWAPVELLRSGVVLHSRGLINSRAIQHNLDWVWPYWVERQFDPESESFVPRAFSVTHINLTHRNWTAAGIPGYSSLPLVDPRGLVTPLFDGWSIDGWVVMEDGHCLIPARLASLSQRLEMDGNLRIDTRAELGNITLDSETEVVLRSGVPVCRITYAGFAHSPGWLVVALRPYNPEGVSFIHKISLLPDRGGWEVNHRVPVRTDPAPERTLFSCYREGDVYHRVLRDDQRKKISCDVGMATAAALYPLEPGVHRRVSVEVPLREIRVARPPVRERTAGELWGNALEGHCALSVPDERMRFLYDAALRTLILHSPGEVFAGPYTYKRFWFRDAVFIAHALLCAGLERRAERVMDRFPARQTSSGYFHSQDGEWDSNGQALWVMGRFSELTGKRKLPWRDPVRKALDWICRKRIPENVNAPCAGLLPAGYSAEHLGPNDYYFWDDFWGVAGLRAGGRLLKSWGVRDTGKYLRAAEQLLDATERALRLAERRIGRPAMPPSPSRRLDSGSIGSLAAGYPMQLWKAEDPRLLDTAGYLAEECLVDGAFFHDMTHSGINPYLTLHIAQIFLRAGDMRYFDLMSALADLASPTGQWPEAIHPLTLGGCMGDGQHAWAAAEWIMMIRNCFVHEEEYSPRLVLCAGIHPRWRTPGASLSFGPAPTRYGPVSLTIACGAERIRVAWSGEWSGPAPKVEVRMPGFHPVFPENGTASVELISGERAP